VCDARGQILVSHNGRNIAQFDLACRVREGSGAVLLVFGLTE
jgi:hypothetical protein